MGRGLGTNGSTHAWRRTRERVLMRDGWTCQLHGPRCRGEADTVDHLVPRKLGGDDADYNLVAACGPCNYSKGGRMAGPEVFNARSDTPASVSLSLPGMADTQRTTHVEVKR